MVTRTQLNITLYVQYIACLVCAWISEQTATVSLYGINCAVLITDMENVYCAVRTGSSYVIQVHPLKSSGHYMYYQFNIHKFYILPKQWILVLKWLCRIAMSSVYQNRHIPFQHAVTLVFRFCKPNLGLLKQRFIAICTNIRVSGTSGYLVTYTR
jgi:hypothetical protein